MEHLLEPQLIDLMDDDEQHLVMLLAPRRWRLKIEELVEAKIAGVGIGQRGLLPSLRKKVWEGRRLRQQW
jgi:hypothetical protein